ncbi:hypothetical protein Xen7305DRAFT_00003800 [Xenococcus sp. PCC 7305]|uniref:hypothetical protein n=1 Tax=Xenococcus sp. PCC 7305 TaxID=102125 RepID=UPI0002ACD5FA|nr:hypothetical protein [Xenococcus sp. PCC 7305]ELS00679.1 hypothetical protein Xen7305DRAFT_00003800 [Xenococcus sp. PCC 7305]
MNKNKCELYDLSKELKNNHKINRDISKYLTNSQKAELLSILENNQAVSKLIRVLIAKNKALGATNRKIGKQRNSVEHSFKKEREKNERLTTEISQLKYELQELKSQMGITLISFQEQLLSNILGRSEIIKFIQELIHAIQESNQHKEIQ